VITGVLGWLVLLFGFFVALLSGLLLHAIWTVGVGLAVALPMILLTLGLGVPLVVGGRALRRSGTDAERVIREQALLSMLAEHGPLSAARAAGALGVRIEEADALLTALAKRQPERVALDIDDEGTVWFRAAAGAYAQPQRIREPPARVRVGDRTAHDQAEEGAEVDAAGQAREKTAP